MAPNGYPHRKLAARGKEQALDKPSGLQKRGPITLE
ncbi:Hypothetical protein CCH01_008750 [Clostridium chauvoei JF4335]|nr:Hypothetical protein CCH01_008750 [Clostridium chauvoei JF4335]